MLQKQLELSNLTEGDLKSSCYVIPRGGGGRGYTGKINNGEVHVQSILALRTPHYYGHTDNTNSN